MTTILLRFIRVYLSKLICDRIHNQLNQITSEINTRKNEPSMATDLARTASTSEELDCKMEKTKGGLVRVQMKGNKG
jgi:hypothetical protein